MSKHGLIVFLFTLFAMNSFGQKEYTLKEIDSIRNQLNIQIKAAKSEYLEGFEIEHYLTDSSSRKELDSTKVLYLQNMCGIDLPKRIFLEETQLIFVRIWFSDTCKNIKSIKPINSTIVSFVDLHKIEEKVNLSNQTMFLNIHDYDFALNQNEEFFGEHNNIFSLSLFSCTGDNITNNIFNNFKKLKSLTLIAKDKYADISNIKKFSVEELIINIDPNLPENLGILKNSTNLKRLILTETFVKYGQKQNYFRKISPDILDLKNLDFFRVNMTLSKKNLKVLTSMTFLDEIYLNLKGKIGSKRLTKFINQLKNDLPNVNLILYDKNGEEIKLTNDNV